MKYPYLTRELHNKVYGEFFNGTREVNK